MAAWLLSMALAILTCTFAMPETVRGVQCPTAPVQMVKDVKYVRNCCGHLVAVSITRAPREGDAAFKQCRCAEKQAAEKQAQAKSSENRGLIVVYLNHQDLISQIQRLAVSQATPRLQAAVWCSLSSDPATPPPQFI